MEEATAALPRPATMATGHTAENRVRDPVTTDHGKVRGRGLHRHHRKKDKILNIVMMKQRPAKFIAAILCLLLTYTAIAKEPEGAYVTIVFEPVFNGQSLKLSSQPYVNEHGDTVFIDLLRFYVTNVKLSSGEHFFVDAHSHLLDVESNSLSFKIDHLPEASYSDLDLIAGVDSASNTSGANEGDLDPAKGMYWAWNSGYIMAKLEGHSSRCKTLHHAFEFHIGGYKSPYNTERAIRVHLPENILVKNGRRATIKIQVDAAAWFSDGLDISKTNSVVIPGKDAARMADRYTKMFRVTAVKYD
jgi:hypothetical protein